MRIYTELLHSLYAESVQTSVPSVMDSEEIAIHQLHAMMAHKLFTVRCVISRKCPFMGCWLEINDGSDQLMIDLAGSDTTVRQLKTGDFVSVHGQIGKVRGGEFGFLGTQVALLSPEN